MKRLFWEALFVFWEDDSGVVAVDGDFYHPRQIKGFALLFVIPSLKIKRGVLFLFVFVLSTRTIKCFVLLDEARCVAWVGREIALCLAIVSVWRVLMPQ